MREDEEHLNLLSVFHYVVGALTAVASCVFLVHVAMGIAVVCGLFDGQGGPPRALGWLFIVFPSMLILGGWTLAGFIIAAGHKLRRRTSRTFCLVVAGCECMLMPFGTILGIFTLLVLMRDSVRELFLANQAVEATF